MQVQLTSKSSFFSKRTFIELVCYAHVFLFLYAGIYKLLDYRFFVEQLKLSPVIGIWAGMFAWAVPSVEIMIAVILLFPRTKSLGLYSAFGLMSIFTIYIFFLLNFSPMVPCSCGGILSGMGWHEHLYFNSGFVLFGAVALYLNRRNKR